MLFANILIAVAILASGVAMYACLRISGDEEEDGDFLTKGLPEKPYSQDH